jgi:hypothetical protein
LGLEGAGDELLPGVVVVDFVARATGKLQAIVKTISTVKTNIFLDINLNCFFHLNRFKSMGL